MTAAATLSNRVRSPPVVLKRASRTQRTGMAGMSLIRRVVACNARQPVPPVLADLPQRPDDRCSAQYFARNLPYDDGPGRCHAILGNAPLYRTVNTLSSHGARRHFTAGLPDRGRSYNFAVSEEMSEAIRSSNGGEALFRPPAISVATSILLKLPPRTSSK